MVKREVTRTKFWLPRWWLFPNVWMNPASNHHLFRFLVLIELIIKEGVSHTVKEACWLSLTLPQSPYQHRHYIRSSLAPRVHRWKLWIWRHPTWRSNPVGTDANHSACCGKLIIFASTFQSSFSVSLRLTNYPHLTSYTFRSPTSTPNTLILQYWYACLHLYGSRLDWQAWIEA